MYSRLPLLNLSIALTEKESQLGEGKRVRLEKFISVARFKQAQTS